MNDSHRQIVHLYPLLLLLPFVIGEARAQPPMYRIGAPYPPARDPRLTSDNGIPGTGSYYYRDYPYPSLREALQEYGLFGRRFQARTRGPCPGENEDRSGGWPAQRARGGVGDEIDRLPLDLHGGARR